MQNLVVNYVHSNYKINLLDLLFDIFFSSPIKNFYFFTPLHFLNRAYMFDNHDCHTNFRGVYALFLPCSLFLFLLQMTSR